MARLQSHMGDDILYTKLNITVLHSGVMVWQDYWAVGGEGWLRRRCEAVSASDGRYHTHGASSTASIKVNTSLICNLGARLGGALEGLGLD